MVNSPNDDYNLFKALTSMRYLQNVVLVNTNLTEVPDKVFQKQLRPQASLTSIDMNGNTNLKSLGSEAFNDLTNITMIDLSGNKLQKIASKSFQLNNIGNGNISLNISNNQINLIDSYAFTSETAHMFIDLSKNNLNSSSFSANAFTNISKPSTIKLADNAQIKFLSQNLFEAALTAGHEFTLERIVLNCDCSMYWLLLKRTQYKKQILRAVCDDDFDLFEDDRIEYMHCT